MRRQCSTLLLLRRFYLESFYHEIVGNPFNSYFIRLRVSQWLRLRVKKNIIYLCTNFSKWQAWQFGLCAAIVASGHTPMHDLFLFLIRGRAVLFSPAYFSFFSGNILALGFYLVMVWFISNVYYSLIHQDVQRLWTISLLFPFYWLRFIQPFICCTLHCSGFMCNAQ